MGIGGWVVVWVAGFWGIVGGLGGEVFVGGYYRGGSGAVTGWSRAGSWPVAGRVWGGSKVVGRGEFRGRSLVGYGVESDRVAGRVWDSGIGGVIEGLWVGVGG